jgi:hypothetical protein
MAWRWKGAAVVGGMVVASLLTWEFASPAQQVNTRPTRFEFQVVESFDAQYLGDTPGHIGRGGGLGERKPDVALGDPVFRGDQKVGKVTNLKWERSKDSLEIEFDPEPLRFDANGRALGPLRIAVGDEVWIPLGGSAAPKGAQ